MMQALKLLPSRGRHRIWVRAAATLAALSVSALSVACAHQNYKQTSIHVVDVQSMAAPRIDGFTQMGMVTGQACASRTDRSAYALFTGGARSGPLTRTDFARLPAAERQRITRETCIAGLEWTAVVYSLGLYLLFRKPKTFAEITGGGRGDRTTLSAQSTAYARAYSKALAAKPNADLVVRIRRSSDVSPGRICTTVRGMAVSVAGFRSGGADGGVKGAGSQFSDTVVFADGEVLENVRTAVTRERVVVALPNGDLIVVPKSKVREIRRGRH